MRLFFALPIEAPTSQRVQAFQESVPVEARLVRPELIHVTLYRKLRKALPIIPPVIMEWVLKRSSLMDSASPRRGENYRGISHWPKSR